MLEGWSKQRWDTSNSLALGRIVGSVTFVLHLYIPFLSDFSSLCMQARDPSYFDLMFLGKQCAVALHIG